MERMDNRAGSKLVSRDKGWLEAGLDSQARSAARQGNQGLFECEAALTKQQKRKAYLKRYREEHRSWKAEWQRKKLGLCRVTILGVRVRWRWLL